MRYLIIGLGCLFGYFLISLTSPIQPKILATSTTPYNFGKPLVLASATKAIEPIVPTQTTVTVDIPTSITKPVTEPVVASDNCYASLLSKYDWNVSVAIEVVKAESSCVASNENSTDYHPTCLGSRGLFSIGCDSTDNYAGMFDAEANIAQAYNLYKHRGWEPWGSVTCSVKVNCY